MDIISELRADMQKNLVKRGVKEFRLSHDCLEVHDREGPECVNRWRLVIPDIPEVKKQIMEEVHSVPYSGHVGYQKTLKKIQQNFYWPDHTLDIREFVISCPVCQAERVCIVSLQGSYSHSSCQTRNGQMLVSILLWGCPNQNQDVMESLQ